MTMDDNELRPEGAEGDPDPGRIGPDAENGFDDDNLDTWQPEGAGSQEPDSLDSQWAGVPGGLAFEAELSAERDKYVRLYADFENFKKRTAKEKGEIYSYATVPLIEKLLGVLDSFERARAASGAADATVDPVVYEGFLMVGKHLAEILASEGLERIATVGEAFNPLVHNGIATESDPDKNEDVVTEEFLAGYRLKDKVIRPALVKVNKNSCRPVCSGC